MVCKLNEHYSMNCPGSVYDEEALTALELAARTAKKVNECVEEVNKIPHEITDEVQRQIDNGTFDDQVDKYAGDLKKANADNLATMNTKLGATQQEITTEMHNLNNATNARINNLSTLQEGSTTGDAELIDARTSYTGDVYQNAGEAIRKGDEMVLKFAKNKLVSIYGLADPVMRFIDIDNTTKTIRLNYAVSLECENCTYAPPAGLTIDFSSVPSWEIAVCYDTVNMTGYIIGLQEPLQKPWHVHLFTAYLADGNILNVSGCRDIMNAIYIDGTPYKKQMRQRSIVLGGMTGNSINIDTTAQTITIDAIVFPDAWKYVLANSSVYYGGYVNKDGGESVAVCLDTANNIVIRGQLEIYPTDHLLFQMFANSAGVQDIYALPGVEKMIYINGAPYIAPAPTTNENIYYTGDTVRAFKKIVCVGDSYGAGYIDGADYPDFSWVQHMADQTAQQYENCCFGGATGASWLTDNRGLAKAKTLGKPQAFIVGLGLNDCWGGYALGTTANIGGDTSTYYGAMSQIVRELNTINPKAKILMLTVPRENEGNFAQYNQAIRDIATAYRADYDCHCIDLSAYASAFADVYAYGMDSTNHLSAIGQAMSAKIMARAISEYMNNNHSLFADIQTIPFN